MFACIHGEGLVEDRILAEFAYSFSPLVERTAVDTVVLDASGCELLFGSVYQLENEIASRAVQLPPTGLGRKVNVAVAANADAAINAATFFKGVTFIASG